MKYFGKGTSHDEQYTQPDKLYQKCCLSIVNTRNTDNPFEKIDNNSRKGEIP